jgi:DDE superfamily endonuclease
MATTISQVVHEASEALLYCRRFIFQPAILGAPVPIQVANFAKFSPIFDNCIGALNGTFIPAWILLAEQQLFIDRNFSQNILGVANFDLTFAFGLFGWEGSAHDSRVYHESRLKGLPMFPGKFIFGDGGIGLSEVLLTPFKRVRYHLKEFEVNGPVNAKELFNLRHASLRNVIERMYGNIKLRFPVLVKLVPMIFIFNAILFSTVFCFTILFV